MLTWHIFCGLLFCAMAEDVAYDAYVVIADFAGVAENELSIRVGDSLIVLQTTPEGWSEGYTSDGRQGWFPTAYAKFNPAGRDEVIEEIKEAHQMSFMSTTQPNSTQSTWSQASLPSTNVNVRNVVSISKEKAKTKQQTKDPFPGIRLKSEEDQGAFPGVRLRAVDESGGGAFPGIRLRTAPGMNAPTPGGGGGGGQPFPGIRHHVAAPDKNLEKKKKAEEKKKEKERRKKEREMRKDVRMFGAPLKATVSQEGHESMVPFIVRCCVAHLLKGDHLLREGIFRLSGAKPEIDALKVCFDAGVEANCYEAVQKADLDAVTGVLKQYFRELPDPLFTYQFYGKFVKFGVEKNLAGIKSTLQTLPPGHKETIVFMLGLLTKVTEYQDRNKMTESNVGIVFVPTLMRSPSDDDDENDEPESLKSAFFFMIQNASSFLKDEPKISSLLQTLMAEHAGNSTPSVPTLSHQYSAASLPPPVMSGPLPPPIGGGALPPSIANIPPPIF
jgi:hypothetical protein